MNRDWCPTREALVSDLTELVLGVGVAFGS
jgi:hypothetical protein